MATIDVDFEWHRALEYEIAISKEGPAIRQKSARLERCWPLRDDANLYLRFAALDGSPQQILAFARSWGFLYGLPRTMPEKGAEESVRLWRDQIKFLRTWIETFSSGQDGAKQAAARGFRTRVSVAKIDVLLSTDMPGPRRALVLKPQSLMDAMLIQFAQAQASGAAIASCEQCGAWFEVGASGRRTVAKFCSDSCRHRFNNERRARK